MNMDKGRFVRTAVLVIGGVASIVAIGLFGLWLWLALSALVLGSGGFRQWVTSQEGYRARTARLPLWRDGSRGWLFVSLTMVLLPLALFFGFLMLFLVRSGRTFAIMSLIGLAGLLILHVWFVYGDKGLDVKAIGGSVASSLRFAGEKKRLLGLVPLGVIFPLLIGLLTMSMSRVTAADVVAAQELAATEIVVEDEPSKEELAAERGGFTAIDYEENSEESAETADAVDTATAQPTSTTAPTWTAEPTKVPTATIAPTNTPQPTRVPTRVTPLVRVNAASVNLRDGPGTQYGIVDVGLQDDEYEVLGITADNGWFNVAAKNGLRFWIAASVVNELKAGSTSRVGVVSTIPAPPEPTSAPLPTATAVPPTVVPPTAVPVAPTAVPEAPTEPPPPPPAEPAPAQECTPGYSPCIPPGSDVDCAGGSGNGPRYVQGPVQVTGGDPYGLDRDRDGVGCE